MSAILIVDDEKNMLISLEAIFRDEGLDVFVASSGEEALQKIRSRTFDLMISDLKMSKMTGLELLEEVKRKNPTMPIILITAYATPKSAVETIKMGAFDYIAKPFDPEEIIFSVRKALEFKSIHEENLQLKGALQERKILDEIIGEDPEMVSIRELIQTVAPTQATVLVQGESGTGKEIVAKAIHELSSRSLKPFIPVNCAAIPEALLESELFGHEKGAFTGALYTKKGKFELAGGGTIYLDEIGDMPLSLQAKILRVLEDGKFERVGGTTSLMSSDSRIISATNKDLKKEITDGSFREDLYFRLNVMSIYIPPLRERGADIPKLVEHFIQKFNLSYSKNIIGVDSEVLQILGQYSWPGNIRELRNIIERAMILEKDPIIRKKSLPSELLHAEKSPSQTSIFSDTVDFKSAVETYEKGLIEWALQKYQNRVSASAKALGLSRHALRHYLLKYFKGEREDDSGE
ncbi:MAG: sigma-54-dependent Fis family transcriptional regulator [Chlamydiae bacterium]|nr:sigma-54-dependent Fis family transcriptional regulator [Chlamydiota bacterium]MBI3277844.1 sigma-54-dependent Fis family transcriptional regulator [Chlamydiota bacterium]